MVVGVSTKQYLIYLCELDMAEGDGYSVEVTRINKYYSKRAHGRRLEREHRTITWPLCNFMTISSTKIKHHFLILDPTFLYSNCGCFRPLLLNDFNAIKVHFIDYSVLSAISG